MIHFLANDQTRQRGGARFHIDRLRPGQVRGRASGDSGLGPLGLIDHASLPPTLVVRMHEHRNDEIVSYLWRGEMMHEDSEGHMAMLAPGTLMVMNSGKGFSHEESVGNETVEMLQIFIRPELADLPPQVQIKAVGWPPPHAEWRPLVGPPGSGSPLSVRQQIHLLDRECRRGDTFAIPQRAGFDSFLYVVTGEIDVGGRVAGPRSAILIEDNEAAGQHVALSPALLVLFHMARDAKYTRAGTLSG